MKKIFHLILLLLLLPRLGISEIIFFPKNKDTQSNNFYLKPFASDPSKTTISGTPTTAMADGISVANIVVQVKDNSGNDVGTGGETVMLISTLGTLSSVTDNGDGTYEATLTSTTSGFAIIFGTLNGTSITDNHIVQFIAGAPNASKSTISGSPVSLEANGSDNSTITVQLKDANGNNITTGGETVKLSTTLGLISTITDNENGTYTATTNSTVSGFATITGKLNGTNIGDNEFIQFNPGSSSPEESTINSNPVSIVANGTSTSYLFIQLKDSLKNNLTTGGETVTLQTNLGTLTTVTDHGDGSYSAKITSATVTGIATITAKLNGINFVDNTQVELVAGPPNANQSLIIASPTNIIADGVSNSTITVQARDVFGNNRTSGGDIVNLTTTKGSLSAVTDNNNGTYTATLTSTTSTDTATITGILNGGNIGDNEIVYFNPGPADPTSSTVTCTEDTLVADGISNCKITIQLTDYQGNKLLTGGDNVTATTNTGSLSLVVDNGDGTYQTIITSGVTSGTANVIINLNGTNLTNTATVYFKPGESDPTTSIISADPTSIVADGIATSTIIIQLKDKNDNNVLKGGETISLSSTLGNFSNVSDNNDGTYTSILTSSTVTGKAELTAKLNGVDFTNKVTVDMLPGIADPNQSFISASTDSILANGITSTSITVQLKDNQGNKLNVGGDVVVLNTTLGTLSPITDNNNGTYTASITSSTSSGMAIITGALNGTSITNIDSVNFFPGDPDLNNTTLNVDKDSIVADGVSKANLTVQLKDQFGNNINTGGENIVFFSTQGTIGSTIDNGNGTYSSILRSTTHTGKATVTVELNNTKIQDEQEVYFIPGPASITKSIISSSPSNILADGIAQSSLLIELFDKEGNKITQGGDLVTLTSSIGTLSPVTDNNNGSYSAYLTSTKAGFSVITGKIGGLTIMDNEIIQLQPGAASVSLSTITPSKDTIVANGISTAVITVQLKDENGNNLNTGGYNVKLNSTSGNLSGITDLNDGTYTAILTAGFTPDLAIISGEINAVTMVNKTKVNMVAGPASTLTTTINSTEKKLLANGITQTTITVQLKDNLGNDVKSGDDIIELETNLGTLSAVSNNSNGIYTAKLTSSTKAGTATIKGKLNGSPISDTAIVEFFPGLLDLTNTTLTASPTEIIANGIAQSTITIQAKDENGNNLIQGGGIVKISATMGSVSPVTDNGNGTYSCTLTSSTTTGNSIISGSYNLQNIVDTTKVVFIPGSANPVQSTIEVSPSIITADEESTSIVTLQLKDAFGNKLKKGGHLVHLRTTKGDISLVTDNKDGTYTAFVTSSSIPDTAIITGKLDGISLIDSAMVIFVPGPGDVETSILTANPDTLIANGVSTTIISVQLRDKFNNNIQTGGENIFITTSLGSISEATDHNNGIYTATLTSPLKVGIATIKAKLNGVNFKQEINVVFIPGPADKSTSIVVADPKVIVANGVSTSSISVVIRDKNNNAITNGTNKVMLSTTKGELSTIINNNNGTYSATLTSSTLADTALVTGNLNGITITNQEKIVFVPGIANANTTVITTEKNEIIANGTSTTIIKIEVLDEFSNPVKKGGGNILLQTNAGALSQLKDLGNGIYQAILTSSTNLETALITGTLNSNLIQDTEKVEFIPDVVDPFSCTITSEKKILTADGISNTVVTVKLFDQFNHPISQGGDSITVSTTVGELSNVVDHNDGSYSSILTSDTLVGTAFIKGKLNGKTIDDTDSVKFIHGAASIYKSIIQTDDTVIVADGQSKTIVKVVLHDQFGNRILTGGNKVKITSTMGTIGAVNDNDDGTYTTELNSGTKTGWARLNAQINTIAMEDSAMVHFIAGKPSTIKSNISAKDHKLLANGTSQTTITIELYDINNNRLKRGGDIITLQTNAGTIGKINDHQNGIYTASITSPGFPATAIVVGILNGNPMIDTTAIDFYEDVQPSPTHSLIWTNDTIVEADGQSNTTITVELYNEDSIKINKGGFNVSIYSTTGILTPVIDHGNGIYTATISSNNIEVAVITGELNGVMLPDNLRIYFVEKDNLVIVPEGFSPNGDNVNDQFKIVGIEKTPNNTLKIFNRWGAIVYQAKDYQNTWEGYAEGPGIMSNEILPAGTYYYILELGNEITPKSGYFYLKR